jgi:AcrR family transcriptional regulator
MQYFGSKEGLFAAAARWPAEHERVKQATPRTLPAAALADVFERFDSRRTASRSVALMRSCLTHPSATTIVRDEVMCDRTASVAATLEGRRRRAAGGPDRACMMGHVHRALRHGGATARAPRARTSSGCSRRPCAPS